MAKHPAFLPSWIMTLGSILDDPKVVIYVGCDRCGAKRRVDVVALAARVGREYSLVNRRCACRLRPGCGGWNTFWYAYGEHQWDRAMRDQATDERWLCDGKRPVVRATCPEQSGVTV